MSRQEFLQRLRDTLTGEVPEAWWKKISDITKNTSVEKF